MKLQCESCRCRGICLTGEGPTTAQVMIVTDYPVYEDLKIGKAMSGTLGALQRAILSRFIGWADSDVYHTYAIKGDPKGDDIGAKEMSACRVWLQQELAKVQPKLIVAAGNIAKQLLLGPAPAFKEIRGKAGEDFLTGTPVFVTYSIRDVDKYSSFDPDGRTRHFRTGSVPWFYRRDLQALKILWETIRERSLEHPVHR